MTKSTPAEEAWRTDPRERLLAAIDSRWAYSTFGATPKQLVDDFAHHLAERIRAEVERQKAEEVARFGRLDPESELQLGAMQDAADLVDPEAKR